MDEDAVFVVMKEVIVEVVPELKDRTITLDDSMRELGANSIDRAEVLIRTMAALQIKLPLIELAKAKNIREVVRIFLSKKIEHDS